MHSVANYVKINDEKALDCSDAVQDLRDNLASLAQTKFDNVTKKFEEEISLIEHDMDMLDKKMEQTEAKGYLLSSDYYTSLITLEQESIQKLEKEHSSLQETLQTLLNNGDIEPYSEDWYKMVGDIQDVEKAIEDANKSLIDYQNNLRKLEWDNFDMTQDYISQIQSESDFLIDLMSDSDLYNDNGTFNDLGNATAGLHAVSFNTYMSQADDYAKELLKIDKELADDPYNTTLIGRKQELLGLQQDMIKSAEDEKQAIKDLVSDGYQKMLDALQDIIDKRKDALQAEKDLYDYQKSIAEQTKAIGQYEKQLLAFSGDDSEETKNKIQQIKVSLEEAKENLKESEYDKWISDQEQMLDNLYDAAEEWVNQRLDNLEGIILDVINNTNENASNIKATLEEVGEDVSYSLTPEMEKIWSTNDGVSKVVSQYSQNFSNYSTTVQNTLSGIYNLVKQMITSSNQNAQKDIEEVNKNRTDTTNISAPASNPNPPAPPSTPNTDNSSGGGGSSWGSWFINKKDSYPKSKLNVNTSIVDRLKYRDFDSSYSARKSYYSAMGGSGTYTGSSNQNKWMISEMAAHGYKKGSKHIPEDQLAWTQEDGNEIIYRTSDGAMLTPLGQGDMVFTNEMSKRLWEISQGNIMPNMQLPTIPKLDVQLMEKMNGGQTGDVVLQFDGIQMNGVNDVAQFTNELANALSKDKRIGKILVDKTIGLSLGRNSLLSRSR